jgi:hypothetical protein
MTKNVCLWIILSEKSIFDIFLTHKINIYHNWIRIYECLQNIIHVKSHLIIVTNLCTYYKIIKIILDTSCDKINGY